MKKRNIISGIVLIFVFLLSFSVTYGYFSVRVDTINGPNDMEATAGLLRINYEDGDEIREEEIYPDWTETKTVTVTNVGTLTAYYSLDWAELENTIENGELILSMTCVQKYQGVVTGECEGRPVRAVAQAPGTIKNNIEILQGYSHEYEIKFEFIETGEDQNYNQGAVFIGVLNVNGYTPQWYDKCIAESTDLRCVMLNNASDNTLDNRIFHTSDYNETEDTDGDDKGERVYYYKGEVENNYLLLGGMCFRIVRTTENNGVKLRYGGLPDAETNNCLQTGADINVSPNEPFNYSYQDNAHVGYMTGVFTGASSLETDPHTNTYSSMVKETIDNWYDENISGREFESLILDTPYCNDRSISRLGTLGGQVGFTNEGYGDYNTVYGAGARLVHPNRGEPNNYDKPQYTCPRGNIDKFTLKTEKGGTIGYGNNSLDYPVALLTADEVAYAGGLYAKDNFDFFLYTGSDSWLMSPGVFHGSAKEFYLDSEGGLAYKAVNVLNLSVQPVITIDANVNIIDGTGEFNNPYTIE